MYLTIRNPRGILAIVCVTPCCLRPLGLLWPYGPVCSGQSRCMSCSLSIPSNWHFFPYPFSLSKASQFWQLKMGWPCLWNADWYHKGERCVSLFLSLSPQLCPWLISLFFSDEMYNISWGLPSKLVLWQLFFMFGFYNNIEICPPRDPTVRMQLGMEKKG